jgi:hypothetical protein
MIAPSKKIIAVGIVCVALVGSVVYVKINPQQENLSNGFLTTIELPEVVVPVFATEDTTDTDKDGLKDWQEIVQGTDINNPDTDGDGIKDGVEVDNKSNSNSELKVQFNDVYKQFVPHSLTDNLSKDLFSAYVNSKNNRTLNGDGSGSLNDIANSIAQEALNSNRLIDRYDISAIGTFNDNDIDAGKEYGEKFGSMYIQMLERVSNGDADISSIANQYMNFSKSITAIYTPESLATTQTAIGNNFYNTAVMFSIIAKYDEDPIRAALAIKNMRELIAAQPKLFISVANYFTRNGIIFENKDIQRLWANI